MSSDPASLNEEHNDVPEQDSDAHEELSLDQLSQAYAEVMKEQGQGSSDVNVDSEPGSNNEKDSETQDSENEVNSGVKNLRQRQRSLDEIDANDNAGCSVSPNSIVEAILFVGAPTGVKLSGRKLAAVMRDVSPREVKKIVKDLNKEYEKNKSVYRIVEESGNYKMQLQEEFVEVQNHFFGRNRAARLNQNAIDVLAVVAYNQPISRNQVDNVRTKPSSAVLSQLLRRDLIVAEEGPKGAKITFRTTDRFLELFGLGSLEDLPQTSAVSDLEELTDI